jgi:hypothetical protein
VDLELASLLLLELANPSGEISFDDARVVPLGLFQRGRGDVLGQVVETVRHLVIWVGDIRPVAGEDVVSATPEEKGIDPIEDPIHELPGHLVEVGSQPAPAIKAPAPIFVPPSGTLEDAVDSEEGIDNQFHVSVSFQNLAKLLGEGVRFTHLAVLASEEPTMAAGEEH